MQHKYFAASNSAHGFKNYFPEIFSRVDHLYIIKGGPGTGKSSFMKKCALKAERSGCDVEYYFCSSDKDSLDGVIIISEGTRIGMVDGTSPHVWEPKHPGAVEQIINLGEFWNRELLVEQKNEIISLGNKKSAAYKRAYDYLRSCGNLRAVTDSLLRSVVDKDKMKAAAERIARAYPVPIDDSKRYTLPAITDAITMDGQFRFDSFEESAEKVLRAGYLYGVGQAFLCELQYQLEKRGVSLRVAYDAICPWLVNGIFVEDSKTAYVLCKNSECEESDEDIASKSGKFINSKRFVVPEKLRAVRSEIRYNEKITESAIIGAEHAMAEVKIYHFLLEDIYKNAMDFCLLNEYADDFISRLL